VHAFDPGAPLADALGALASGENRNATMNALRAEFEAPDDWERTTAVAF
jgi:hypothetical protein